MMDRLPGFASGAVRGATQLHRETLGEGAACVTFLHGLGGTGRYWQSASHAPRFEGARTELIDLYGFGRSPRPWCRYTLERHLDALERTIAPGTPRVLVGHSLGAALALAFAARHPERVDALCLMALPVYGSRQEARTWFAHQRGGWIYTNFWATALACIVTRRVAGRWLPYLVRDVPPQVARDLVLHNMMSSSTSLWNVLYDRDAGEDARALPRSMAVTCIHGDSDRTAPVQRAAALAHERQWRFIALTGDHHPWLRDPGACHAAIGALVARVSEPSLRGLRAEA